MKPDQATMEMVPVDEDSENGNKNGINPFDVLPPEMLAEIFSYIQPKHRQCLRTVCYFWKQVVDIYFGIHLHVTNMNWNSLEYCTYARTLTLSGFSRDVFRPAPLSSTLVSLEITDFVAYYSFMPLLEHCVLLESLNINCVTFLQKSRLPEYITAKYLGRKGTDSEWLPRLKHFKFKSCTTQSGVYNHIVPTDIPEELFGLENAARTFDISRGEMEFLPFILQILTQSKTLLNIEMILTDIWKIPFGDLLQVNIDSPPVNLDISLWHFGSKRLLPVGNLLEKVRTLKTLRFSFPHHFDSFYIKFYKQSPDLWNRQICNTNRCSYQLEEVAVEQSLRWSQEMREIDIPWIQILGNQTDLKKLVYPFPILGHDQKMLQIINKNNKSLESITFIGHRERQEEQAPHGFRFLGDPESWDAEWFGSCEKLTNLQLIAHMRFLGPTNLSHLSNPHLLPSSLRNLTFHGCIETGTNSLIMALSSLINLEVFTHRARLCPWFQVDEETISELNVPHAKDIIIALPKLKEWNLEWSDPSSSLIANFITSTSAIVSVQVLEWLATITDDVDLEELIVDRQMKSLKIKILSRCIF